MMMGNNHRNLILCPMKRMNFETYPRTIEGQPFRHSTRQKLNDRKCFLVLGLLDELVPVQDENDESDDVAWEDG